MTKNNIKIVLVLLVLYPFTISNAQVTTKYLITDADALNLVYKHAIESSDSIRFRKLFFKLFPNNFNSFNQIYGYLDSSGSKPLYNNYYQHINFFYEQTALIPDSIFFMKIIRIAIEAKWDADAVNLFQDLLFESIHNNPIATLSVLNQFEKKQIEHFCRFIMDGPNPNDQISQKKYLLLLNDFTDDKYISNILSKQFHKLTTK